MRNLLFITALTGAMFLAACAHPGKDIDSSLFARLGGQSGIEAIVDNLLFELSSDEKLLPFFESTNIDRFREKLIEQLCEVSDGPCRYTGDTMAQVHAGMALDNGHFNALVTDLMAAMDQENIAVGAQNDLLARLAAMHAEVMCGDCDPR